MTPPDHPPVGRRTVLASLGAAGATSLAGCTLFSAGESADTAEVSDEQARTLAERFAPRLYFDTDEQWFPTDPRDYESQQDGETVVDGFDALNGYTERANEGDEPPAPTLFYHTVEYDDSPLAVVQYWYYSAFDQFTTNFHWHDWEVLHVFVDTDTDEPQLYVASSHSRRVPNNEFLDPDPTVQPRILSELGSHSSALSVNEVADRFQRLSAADLLADITNSPIETLGDIAAIPLAYGLPRDEGSRLPFLVPELDGAPVYDHERLPAVERSDLLSDALTVGSFADLASPPTDLPLRSTGLVFGNAGDAAADIEYDLVPTAELEHITAFTGPQLSFEFSVPQFAEDAVAGHITTTSVPWDQPRYTDPAADITDTAHRAALAERYDAIGELASVNTVVARISEAITADEAPDGEGLTTQDLPVEGVALLESEPEAVPTFGGVAVVQDAPSGDHRLTINAPGVEPHSETVGVEADAGPTAAGVEGSIPLVARENAIKLGVDARNSDREITDLAVEDDFAGRLYDAPFSESDAVYVHRGGAYTTEFRDSDGAVGAVRVNPGDEATVRIENPQTGTASLASYVADLAEEMRAAVAAVGGRESDTDRGSATGTTDNESGDTDTEPGDTDADSGGTEADSDDPVERLVRALAAVVEAARGVAERAASGERGRAAQQLETVRERLDRVATRLAEASDALPDDLEAATERRLAQSRRRTEQARQSNTL